VDLRPHNPTPEQVGALKGLIGYQPFILNDDVQTGIADIWIHKSDIKSIRRSEVSPETWTRFCASNARLRAMYDGWIDAIAAATGPLEGKTVADTASNAGFFLYRFLEKGAARCTGYDMNPKLAAVYPLLNEITGLNVEFVNTTYDQMTHQMPGCAPADIVISSAIMCHISDPLYYLNYLGSITRETLFLFTCIDDDKRLRITYDEPRRFYPDYDFPICFDNMTTVSRPLIDLGLRELGFRKVIEVPHQPDWMPLQWYNRFKALIALR